jgi:hypothetical protein
VRPAEDIPTVVLPPVIPLTCQVTARSAEKLTVVLIGAVADGGVMVTTGSCTITAAVANLVASAVLTARITTDCGVAGAV